MTTTTALPIIRRLLALTDRFMTSNGHLDFREDIDHRGVCRQRRHYAGGDVVPSGSGYVTINQTLDGTCAPSCQEAIAVRAAAAAYLADHEPRQLEWSA